MKSLRYCLVLGGVLLAGTAGAQSPPVYQPPAPVLRGGQPLQPEPPRQLKVRPEVPDDDRTPGVGTGQVQPIFNLPGNERQQLDAINAMVKRATDLGTIAPNYERIADTLEKGFLPQFFDSNPNPIYEAKKKVAEQNIRLAGIDPKDIRDLPAVPQNGPNGPMVPNGNGQNVDGFKQTIEEINKIFKSQAELIRSIDVGSIRRYDPNINGGEQPAGDGGVVVIGGRTGLQLGLISPTIYEHIRVPRDQGLLIKEVYPKTPAEAAGYKKNDILLELNGKKVPSNLPDFMEKVMRTIKNDVPFNGVVLRNGEPVEIGPMKITDRRVIPALPNERAPDLSSIIQVVPGINSEQVRTNRVPEVRMIRRVENGITITEIVPVEPPKK